MAPSYYRAEEKSYIDNMQYPGGLLQNSIAH